MLNQRPAPSNHKIVALIPAYNEERFIGSVALIPTYNEERFIGSVVLKAGRLVDKVIVVDDGSEDVTVVIAESGGTTRSHNITFPIHIHKSRSETTIM